MKFLNLSLILGLNLSFSSHIRIVFNRHSQSKYLSSTNVISLKQNLRAVVLQLCVHS